MKRIFLITLLLASTSSLIFGQLSYERKFSHEIEQKIEDGALLKSSAAYQYTFIGDYEKALEQYDLALDWNLDTLTQKDSLTFLNYQVVDEKEYLSERSKQTQITIISEAHHKPQHRVFTTELLATFYENGYRYLGLETLTPSFSDSTQFLMDTLLNQRGYPLNNPRTGTYSFEPQMGKLIRAALALGFELFGYERSSKGLDRDLQQAINIERFMDAHPDGKVLIHCGWYHAIESTYPKRKQDNWLAYHLKTRTGIDPLTIYQDALSEKVALPESPFYQLIDSDQVGILVNEVGEVFNGVDEAAHFDVLVYHPRTTYIRNRPSWLVAEAGNQLVEIDYKSILKDNYPVLVEAFLKNEKDAVPIDVVELKNKNEQTPLLLQAGEYRIRLTNRYKKQLDYDLIVE